MSYAAFHVTIQDSHPVRYGGQNSNADQSYSTIKVSLFTNRDVNWVVNALVG